MILTDHKPLIAISKKALVNAPQRLQCLLLRMNNYNVELNWILGKEMVFSDHLSRNMDASKRQIGPTCKGLDLKIQDVYLNTSKGKCTSLATETDKDETLVALKSQIIKGWPSKRGEWPRNLIEYWNYRDELSILDRLVLKGTRVIIPTQCRKELLEKLHKGHFGVDRTKLRARDPIYWPGINKDIEILVKTCNTCQENSKRNNKDPVLAREIQMCPWTMLELDLFVIDGHTLLVVNMTSRFPVVRILNTESCRLMLNALKGIYCDFGLPRKVLSDNGPCFRAEEFVNFHTKLGIVVEKSSSYNHQSVG